MNIGTQSTVRQRTQKADKAAQKSDKAVLGSNTTSVPILGETRHKMVAEAAYYLAQQRGFTGGHTLADWLEAEERINAMMTKTNARR